jgi:flagellar biosynthesis component FlhA
MAKTRMAKIGIVLGIGIIVALGFISVMAAEEKMAKPVKECTMKDMHDCTMKCTTNCEKNMKETSDVMTMLDAAVVALDAGNTADAKKEIEKAKAVLKNMEMMQKKCIEKMPTVNDACPVSGDKIDMMNTPEKQTTIFKGKKVGFCCTKCPLVWDKLTDAEKEEKLAKVTYKAPEK